MWAGVGELSDKLEDAGAFVFKGGLQGGAESATVVRQSGGDFLLTDGPYAETKEHLAGFWIINAADLDAALEWAKLAAAAEQRRSRSARCSAGTSTTRSGWADASCGR